MAAYRRNNFNSQPEINNIFKSQLEIIHTEKLVWQIDEFLSQLRLAKNLESNFITEQSYGGQNQWFLSIYPKEVDNDNDNDNRNRMLQMHMDEDDDNEVDNQMEDDDEYISIKLRLGQFNRYRSHELSKSVNSSKCLFSIKDSKGRRMEKESFGQYKVFRPHEAFWIVEDFIRVDALLDKNYGFGFGLKPGDPMTIVCKIDFYGIKETKQNLPIPDVQIQIPKNRVVEDMGILFEKREFTDCIIQAGKKEFNVHKCILASRSPVFLAMFGHEMLEAQSNKLMIDDIKAEVMEQLLHFIYDGNAPKLENMADELLVAADKYQLDRLKILCEYALAKSLKIENACQLFCFANFHSAKQLKTQAKEFIKKNLDKIMESDGWKMMNNEQHQLELLESINDKKKEETNDEEEE